MLTIQDIFTSSNKYPEREKEVTEEIKKNALLLVSRVNLLLGELGILNVKVSSGFRPSSINSKIANAAKKSLHMSGQAVDLEDSENKLAHKILSHPELLKKYNLWLEDPSATPTWCHLDISLTRQDRSLRVFKP